ncbi:MAG: amylo-alpha-1,6-glucosidase [Thermoleophilia bacterium]|nr:amylo-alpha-1,6-glucosidase [Thermoleophilia bacterium]
MALTILEGSTFCICDDLGDIGMGDNSGFFARDTRFLSSLILLVDGRRPLLLSSSKVDYFSAVFYLRNPIANGLPPDALLIRRDRFVGDAMQDRIVLENALREPIAFELELALGADFADIFLVKEHDFALGRPRDAPPLPPPAAARWREEGRELVFEDASEFGAVTRVVFAEPGEAVRASVRYRVELEPRGRRELGVDVYPSARERPMTAHLTGRRFGEELAHVRESLAAWQLRIPQLRASWDPLVHAFGQSVADLASLRMRSTDGVANLPAAGMPWFMTVFGRDTIITSLQTLLFGPELARGALTALAELQASEDDPAIDAEPGKIVHEVRDGKTAAAWFRRYYGTVDATPLYLILLSEVWRWTDDRVLVRDLREPALRALEWIDRHADRNGDGFIDYERRTERGLENQSWKDSFDSQRFADGSFARPPVAPCEAQGYVYDAKRRVAELARAVWRDRDLADRLDGEAEELRRRFDDAYWVDRRGGYYALALDGEGRRVDSLCSNIGHLLWSGIVPEERVDAVVDRLMGEELWSGWGVRTMSAADAGYNPLAYHNGTVWPHDNSLIAWGLARHGRWPEAQRVARRMVEAAGHFGWQLPEVFAGLPRSECPFPIVYPTSARPQAWASGAPVLLLRVLLGLEPNPALHTLESAAPPELPSWIGDVRLKGVPAFDASWDVAVSDRRVSVERHG